MEKKTIRVKLFHSLEIEYDGKVLKELTNRSQKMWLLLIYLIYFRQKPVQQETLLSELWGDTEVGVGVLKITLHRLRTALAKVFDEELARTLICCNKKIYSLNEDYTVICDYEEFEHYLKDAKHIKGEEEQLLCYQKAFALYEGDFLCLFSDVPWISPISIYFHYLYLNLVRDMLEICERHQRYNDSIEILRHAGEVEKYEESIYIHLIRNLIRTGNFKEAVQVYKHLSDMMSTNYGLQPSEEAQYMYQDALHALSTELVSADEISGLVLEQDVGKGALYCEFDIFKALCQAYYRGVERNGNEIRLVLFNITDIQDKALSKRSLTVCVANLKNLLRSNLRTGDIISMCAPSQFVLLLPNAGEKNAELVMERLEKVFYKQYPHTPAKLTYYVKNLG